MNTHNHGSENSGTGNGNVAEEDGTHTRYHTAAGTKPGAGMGTKLTVFVVIFALALAIGFYLVHHHRVDEEAKLATQTSESANGLATVSTVFVKAAPSSLPLVLPGETHGWYQSVVYARVNGYVDKWAADIGDKVTKGQVLATISTPDLDAQLQAAQQQLTVAQSQIGVARANADFADTTFKRWHDSPKGVVAPQETEQKRAAYDSSVAELKAAQAKASAAQAEVARLQAMSGFKQVTSPFDGIITMRRIDIGNLVTAGSTTNTSPLYDIAQTDTIRVFADVPQDVSGQITVGMTTHTTSKSFPGRVFEGKVARTTRAIDSQTRTLKVEVDIPNPDLTLMPGMYVQITFDVTHGALLEIPASALLFRSTGPQAAVVSSDGKINFRAVTIAVDDGNTVGIGSGISAGDRVALNLSSQVADGQQVNVVDTEKTTTVQTPHPAETTASLISH